MLLRFIIFLQPVLIQLIERSNMHAIAGRLFIFILMIVNCHVYGQYLNVDDGKNITGMPGDELNAEWSQDSESLLFQSVHNGKNTIYLYDSKAISRSSSKPFKG